MKTASFGAILFAAAFSAAAAGGDKPPAAPVKVSNVWVVFKTHFDLGFTDLPENVFARYRVEMMDNALKIIEQNGKLPAEKRFTWTLPGWPLYAQILGPKQEPARRAAIERAIRQGYLAVHALAASSHTESLDAEDLVRSLGFSSKIARAYGRPLPLGAKMTDVPEHSWILATILARAGREAHADRLQRRVRSPARAALVLVGGPGRLPRALQLHALLRLGARPAGGLAGEKLPGDDHGRRQPRSADAQGGGRHLASGGAGSEGRPRPFRHARRFRPRDRGGEAQFAGHPRRRDGHVDTRRHVDAADDEDRPQRPPPGAGAGRARHAPSRLGPGPRPAGPTAGRGL